jgi:hypothetical protein
MLNHLINNDIRVEDSFPIGNFLFNLRIFSDVGRCAARFVLHVGNTGFRDVRMRKLNWLDRLLLKFRFFPRV